MHNTRIEWKWMPQKLIISSAANQELDSVA